MIRHIFTVFMFSAIALPTVARSGEYSFVGAERNGDLIFFRLRHYDAETGVFISKDPLGAASSLNAYSYVSGNPVNLIDPNGDKDVDLVLESVFGGKKHAALRFTDPNGQRTFFEGYPSQRWAGSGYYAQAALEAAGAPVNWGIVKGYSVTETTSPSRFAELSKATVAKSLAHDSESAQSSINRLNLFNTIVNDVIKLPYRSGTGERSKHSRICVSIYY
jgi:RHS repeat-associated protein